MVWEQSWKCHLPSRCGLFEVCQLRHPTWTPWVTPFLSHSASCGGPWTQTRRRTWTASPGCEPSSVPQRSSESWAYQHSSFSRAGVVIWWRCLTSWQRWHPSCQRPTACCWCRREPAWWWCRILLDDGILQLLCLPLQNVAGVVMCRPGLPHQGVGGDQRGKSYAAVSLGTNPVLHFLGLSVEVVLIAVAINSSLFSTSSSEYVDDTHVPGQLMV